MFRWLSVCGSFLVFFCLIHLGEKSAGFPALHGTKYFSAQSSPERSLVADSDSDDDDDDDDDIANMC